MTELLRKNPIALRHCLLYLFLQQKSIKEAFDDFCEIVGPGIINKKEFRFWFYLFEQRIVYLEDQPVADINEFIRSDKHALRVCVMYEWLSAKRDSEKKKQFFIKTRPVFTSYMHFCKVIGDGAMEFSDFDFWFYRFANGMFNLKFEKDKEQKIYELTDMPIDIMRNIVEYLDIVDRMSLEKTSQSLRLFSQDQKVFHGHLSFNFFENSAYIRIGNGGYIEYVKQGNDCLMMFRGRTKRIRGVSTSKQILQDFEKFFENPKLHLGTLDITSEDPGSSGRYIEDELKLTHLLHVKHIILIVNFKKVLLNILPSLEPGYLTKISVDVGLDKAAIEEIVEMEQWKQAKYLVMGFKRFVGPLRHLYHFHEFTVSYRNFLVKDAREIKEILLKSPDFEKCALYLQDSNNPLIIMQEFGGAIEGSIDTCHYPIPNSTEYFKIIVRYYSITIERKKK